MIPILYNGDETRFINNGRGRLSDATRCIVTEERNGIYELEIDYPITGVHFEEIIQGRIIAATHDDKGDLQPFEVYRRTVPNLNGIVTFYAHHISYKLNGVTVEPFTAGSCVAALQAIKDKSINPNPFAFWTDKTTTANFNSDEPRNARAMLAGEENSILDVFGSGEYEFDKFTVKLHAARGTDSDCEIRYGKNLSDLNQDIDSSGTFNAIVPFWKDSEGNILMLPEKIIVYEGIEPQITYLTDHNLIVIRTETGEPIEVTFREVDAAPMDLSDAFEEMPTVEQLRQTAKARFESGEYWAPKENLKVDFVQLWQTEEYKDYAGLQRVSLCDTVSVYYPQVAIAAVKQKVVRTVYNVLLDRYDSIELGAVQTTLGEQIKAGILEVVPTTSMMEEAIQYATDLIRGGLGGYVVMTPGPNGYPQEILIMDTPDVNTAVNVWRFNQGGLGHSSNGYEGPYSDIALTQDGKINASMITTGTLNANRIKAGILADLNNNVTWNLSTGVLTMTKGSITLGNGNFQAKDNGDMTALSGTIGPFRITSTQLIREAGTRYVRIGGTGITYGIEYTDDSRRTATLNPTALQFGYAPKTSSVPWENIPAVASLQLYNDGTALAFVFEGISEWPVLIENEDANFNYEPSVHISNCWIYHDMRIQRDLNVYGTKNRVVKTDNYSERLLYCYETPTPLFGDIGSAKLDEEGICYVDIDDIFTETIAEQVEYQVFLQPEGEGTCYIAEKAPRYFVIKGSPHLKVAWELKAKQKDYETLRLEPAERNLEEYTNAIDHEQTLEKYIKEQEELLNG